MANAAQNTILETGGLTMRFGGLVAVSALDLTVRERAIHSIIGPNGAGKTTVFNCIMQNLQLSAGKILVSRRAPRRPDARSRRRRRRQPHISEHPAIS